MILVPEKVKSTFNNKKISVGSPERFVYRLLKQSGC